LVMLRVILGSSRRSRALSRLPEEAGAPHLALASAARAMIALRQVPAAGRTNGLAQKEHPGLAFREENANPGRQH
jgi:hypothetical protein